MRPLLFLLAGLTIGHNLGGRSYQPRMDDCRQQTDDAIKVAKEWQAISQRLEKTATECLALLHNDGK
jgi:hypothetical protein